MLEPSWAEPDTVLGSIQRGRGACYHTALAQPTLARELVVDCIIRDPRWDHQVEQRDWLYAALIAELGIELSLLRAAYAGPIAAGGDSQTWLATGVFDRLARRRHRRQRNRAWPSRRIYCARTTSRSRSS